MELLNHWSLGLIDILVTTYLVYYYLVNERKKDKENKE